MLTVHFDRLRIRPGMRVLDLGCGGGRHAFEAFRRGGRVVALDRDADQVATTREWLAAMAGAGEAPAGASASAVRGDLLALPFADASFDRVIAAEVLEHLPDDRTAMAELARVLRPGGLAAVTVPRWLPERICWALSTEYHSNEGGHVRIYRGDQLAARLAAAGLQPVERHHAHALHSPYWWLKCATGVHRDSAPIRLYHRVLVWDITSRPWLTRSAERLLDPLIGKSLVLYAQNGNGAVSVPELPGVLTAADVAQTVASIAEVQEPTGAVPWFAGGELDPWDHIEAAMALDVGGLPAQAAKAYRWLRRTQRPDGSWASRYRAGQVCAAWAETNHSAYVAVGCWHHWLATGDESFLAEMWPTVLRALDFVLTMQTPGGAVHWAADTDGRPDPVALLTACSSIHHALRCGLAIADRMGQPQPDWELAVGQLRHAVVHHASAFADRGRYSMDWYYPVLGGALRGPGAGHRLDKDWPRFVVPGMGVRCVADRPWVTGAETCELALALEAVGQREAAGRLVADMQHLRHTDGSYWTGLVFDAGKRWPVERSTWTAAAVVLAVDALDGRHRRAAIFRADELPTGVEIGSTCGVDLFCGS